MVGVKGKSGVYKRTPEMRTGKYKHYSHQGGFKKGHKFIKGGEKGWFKSRDVIGSKNVNWKNGQTVSKGYIIILKPEHPFCNKNSYVRRSHLVMEKIIGRYLKPEEVVHHKGIKYPVGSIENKQDDRPKNLQLFVNHSKHMKFHCSFVH